jgi:serine/threonine-protein kinase HipA
VNLVLEVFAGERPMAHIGHDAIPDTWSLTYLPEWLEAPAVYPLSPSLPLTPREDGYNSHSIKRFIEHLLPEGHALDVAIKANGLAKSNVFGLIHALGTETAGVLRFRSAQAGMNAYAAHEMREIPVEELDARIAGHDIPFMVWDGKVRMSVAGVQDKLLVYVDAPLEQGGRLFLVEGPRLASTHILKPDFGHLKMPHLAINEHFCMTLARRIGLPAAEVHLLRTPRPVLVVRRFDRIVQKQDNDVRVERRHMIDACQACDLPVNFKYERNYGKGDAVRDIREGMSFERLFGLGELTGNKAKAKLTMLRWALFQFLIGNSDAHGKNFSFFVGPGGYLEPTPWYDLVSVVQYAHFDTDLAMAYGDAFTHDEVTPFALADFAIRCGIDRRLMQREAQRMADAASRAAIEVAYSSNYHDEELAFVVLNLVELVSRQAKRLAELARAAVKVPAELL